MGMHVCGQAGGGDGEHGGPLGTSLTSLCVCRFMAWLLPSFRVYACRFIRFVSTNLFCPGFDPQEAPCRSPD